MIFFLHHVMPRCLFSPEFNLSLGEPFQSADWIKVLFITVYLLFPFQLFFSFWAPIIPMEGHLDVFSISLTSTFSHISPFKIYLSVLLDISCTCFFRLLTQVSIFILVFNSSSQLFNQEFLLFSIGSLCAVLNALKCSCFYLGFHLCPLVVLFLWLCILILLPDCPLSNCWVPWEKSAFFYLS